MQETTNFAQIEEVVLQDDVMLWHWKWQELWSTKQISLLRNDVSW